MVLACKFKSRTQWEFHFDEWMSTWARTGPTTIVRYVRIRHCACLETLMRSYTRET